MSGESGDDLIGVGVGGGNSFWMLKRSSETQSKRHQSFKVTFTTPLKDGPRWGTLRVGKTSRVGKGEGGDGGEKRCGGWGWGWRRKRVE